MILFTDLGRSSFLAVRLNKYMTRISSMKFALVWSLQSSTSHKKTASFSTKMMRLLICTSWLKVKLVLAIIWVHRDFQAKNHNISELSLKSTLSFVITRSASTRSQNSSTLQLKTSARTLCLRSSWMMRSSLSTPRLQTKSSKVLKWDTWRI